MRLAHLSDLHLGKRVNEFSMLEDQRYILKQIEDILAEEAVQAGTLRTVTLDCPELLTTNSIVCHRDRYQTGPMKAFLQAALMSEN